MLVVATGARTVPDGGRGGGTGGGDSRGSYRTPAPAPPAAQISGCSLCPVGREISPHQTVLPLTSFASVKSGGAEGGVGGFGEEKVLSRRVRSVFTTKTLAPLAKIFISSVHQLCARPKSVPHHHHQTVVVVVVASSL